MKKCLPFVLFLLSFSVLWLDCEKDTAPLLSRQPELSLTAEDVTCTEAWLRLTVDELPGQAGIRLLRNDSIVYNEPLTASDTLLYDKGLLPNAGYRYRALLTENGKLLSQSPVVSMQTMDTTSHDITWSAYTFGGSASSPLFDAAIVKEDGIWATGDISAIDGTYNAVHWDGQQWELKRIPFVYQGSNFLGPIYAVFALSTNDVWFGMGSIIHWDGTAFNSIKIPDEIFPSRANKIWGSPNGALYLVGNQGHIAYSPDHGTSWQKLESGTEFDFQDIWGVADSASGQSTILAVACNRFTNDGSAVVQITGNTAALLPTSGLPSNISGIWSADGREWYICGDGLFRSRDLNQPWQEVPDQPLIYKEKVRGNGINDVFVVGHFGLVSHWNGYSWYTYPSMPGLYHGLAVKGDLMVAVGQITSGWVGGAASILVGRRH